MLPILLSSELTLEKQVLFYFKVFGLLASFLAASSSLDTSINSISSSNMSPLLWLEPSSSRSESKDSARILLDFFKLGSFFGFFVSVLILFDIFFFLSASLFVMCLKAFSIT